MSDAFENWTGSPSDPARKLVAVTPNDAADLAAVCKALWIGTAGTLVVTAAGDTASVSLTVGQGLLPVRVKRVHATGTSATGLVALY